MFCPQCGRKLDESLRFCAGCGRKLDDITGKISLLTEGDDTKGLAFAPDAAHAVFAARTEDGAMTEQAETRSVLPVQEKMRVQLDAVTAAQPAAWTSPAVPDVPAPPVLPERREKSFAVPLLFGAATVAVAALVFCTAYFGWYTALPWFKDKAEETQNVEETPQSTSTPRPSVTPEADLIVPAPVPAPQLDDVVLVSGMQQYGVRDGSNIYYTGTDKDGNDCIMRYSEDSGMSIIFATFAQDWVYPYSYAVLEDNLLVMASYYDEYGALKSLCFSVPLSGGAMTYLFMLDGFCPMYMDGGEVYVAAQTRNSSTLYLYNGSLAKLLSGDEASEVLGYLNFGISIQEGVIYYTAQNGVYTHNLASDEREVVCELRGANAVVTNCYRVGGALWMDVLSEGEAALVRYEKASSDTFVLTTIISGGGYEGIAGMYEGRLLLAFDDEQGKGFYWMNPEASYETEPFVQTGDTYFGRVICNSILVWTGNVWHLNGSQGTSSYTDLGLVDTSAAQRMLQQILAELHGYENHGYRFPRFGEAYGRAQENGGYLYFLLGSEGVDGPGDIYRIKREALENGDGALELYCDFGGKKGTILDFAVLNDEILFSSTLNAPEGECGYYAMDKNSGEYRFLYLAKAPMEMRVWDNVAYMLDSKANTLYGYQEYGDYVTLVMELSSSMNLSRYFSAYDGNVYLLRDEQLTVAVSLNDHRTMRVEAYPWSGMLPMSGGLVLDGSREGIRAIWGDWIIEYDTARRVAAQGQSVDLWLDTHNPLGDDAADAIAHFEDYLGMRNGLEPADSVNHYVYQTILSAGSGDYLHNITAWYNEGTVSAQIYAKADGYTGVLYAVCGAEYVMEPDIWRLMADGVYQEAGENGLEIAFTYDETLMGNDFYLMVGLVREDGIDAFALNLYR